MVLSSFLRVLFCATDCRVFDHYTLYRPEGNPKQAIFRKNSENSGDGIRPDSCFPLFFLGFRRLAPDGIGSDFRPDPKVLRETFAQFQSISPTSRRTAIPG
jgi:hypothetical protein